MRDLTQWQALDQRLPQLIEEQFAAYRRLAHTLIGPEDGPRDLVAWENAKKAALGHLQALIRIYSAVQSQLATNVKEPGAGQNDLFALLADVRRELEDSDEPEDFTS